MTKLYIHYTSLENLFRILMTNKILISFTGDYGAGLYVTNNSPFSTDTHLLMHMFDMKRSKNNTVEKNAEIEEIKEEKSSFLEYFLIIEIPEGKIHPARSIVNKVARKSQYILEKNQIPNLKIIRIGQRVTNSKGHVLKVNYFSQETILKLKDVLNEYQCSINLSLSTENVDYTQFLTLDHKSDKNDGKIIDEGSFNKDNIVQLLKEIELEGLRRSKKNKQNISDTDPTQDVNN